MKMKLNLLITTILATGALALPLRAQTPAPADTPAATTEATPAATTGTTAATLAAQKSHFGGKLGAVDTTAKTITVQNKRQGPRTFQVTDSTKITKTDGSPATLADLMPGDHVHGAFKTTDDGKLELLTLKIGPAKKK